MKSKPKLELKTDNLLERHVIGWVNRQMVNSDNWIEDVFQNLAERGCSSGIVNHLIYTVDTIRFFHRYKKEINELLNDHSVYVSGASLADIIKDFDETDHLCLGAVNQNLLAWFGFEKTAENLALAYWKTGGSKGRQTERDRKIILSLNYGVK